MTGERNRVQRFLADRRRRRILRVAAGYVVVAWFATEVAAAVFPVLDLPGWTPTLVLVLAFVGLPVALLRVWGSDGTPVDARHGGSADSADGWTRVQRVLETALELPDAERDGYIARAAGSDEALRADVQALLRAHACTGPLDRPVSDWAEPLVGRPVPAPPAEGRTVGQYEILEKLGGGGMGVVHRARDRRLGRVVALKFLSPHLSHHPEAKQRFVMEAQAAAALDHPHICTLFEIGETRDGQLYLAMPCYDGETLKRRLARGPLPVAEAIDVATQTARGLAAAHAKGIVHRDIKPANLIITGDGVVKIVDFGVAKLTDVSVTRAGFTPGTVAYMSPEQARGEAVDARADVWSLGVVLYEALAGRRPFSGGSELVTLQAVQRADPDPLGLHRPDVPPAVEELVHRALAAEPAARYGSGAEMHAALVSLLGHTAPPGERSAGSPADSAEVQTGSAVPTLTPEGERRQATVVRSSVTGYAALVERLTPEEIRGVMARVRASADEVAARFGGIVNRSEDDRLELLFGVPTSHEDHCFRAVRAALELHERVRGITAGSRDAAAVRLALQSGVDTGQVVARAEGNGERFSLTGGPAHGAGSLHTRAGPDELWITPACQRMVGPFFETEPGEPVLLRSDRPEVVPHRVLRLSGLRTRIEAAERTGFTRYVGRQEEVNRLTAALEEARTGRGQLMTIIGHAGVGKSRLIHEFQGTMAGADVTVLEGRCESFGGLVAYLPFIEVLRGALELEGAAAADRAGAVIAALRSTGSELEEFIPLYLHLLSLAHRDHPLPAHLQGEPLRHAMQEAVAGLLTLMTRHAPVVLILEDWHWSDDASHAVLRQVAEVAAGHALLVVVTSRPGVASWGSPPRQTTLALEPLGADASAEMLCSVLNARELPEPLAERVHERTGGNPFFIEEIGRTLVEEDAVRVRDGVVALVGTPEALHLPDTVESVIRARLDRLDRDARDVARVAAVIGREFERRLLEHAMDGRSRLPHAIQALKAAGLIQQIRVVPEATYRFHHVLTREVAYASLLERQRAGLHGRVAGAIERIHGAELDEFYDRLAEHFSQAGIWDRAVHYGVRAADRLTELCAFPDALQQLERCEVWIGRLEEDGTTHNMLVEVLLRQERLSETLGLRARQQQLIDQLVGLLEETDDRRNLAQVYVRQGDLYTLLRRFADAERVLLEALRLNRAIGDPDAIRSALRSLGLVRWHEDRLGEAIAFIEETLAIDRERGDVEAQIGDLSNLGAVLKGMGELQRARVSLEEALAVIDAEGGQPQRAPESVLKECYILHNLANVHRELGQSDVALIYLDRAKQLTERERLPIQLSYHFTSIAHMYLREGRLEESLEYYRQAVEASRRARFTPGLSQALRMLGEVLMGLGRDEEALPCLEEAAGLFAQLEDSAGEATLWRDVARAHEHLGRADDARAAWQRAAPLFARCRDDEGELEALEAVARATRKAGRSPGEAARAHAEALERAAALGALDVQGRLLNALGIIAWERQDYDGALRHYQAAYKIFRRLHDDAGTGLMLNSIGVTLKAMGRRAEARKRLEAALPVHRHAGNRLLEGHAFAALGDMALEDGEPDRALWLFTESLALREDIGDRVGAGWMQARIAAAHAALARPELAAAHASVAREIAEESGDTGLAAACERLITTAPSH